MSDIEIQQRLMRPFVKRVMATANGAWDGSTIVAPQVPAVGEFGLGEADDFWNDAEVLILTGDMKNQLRQVTDYVQATGTLTLDHRFINPDVSLLTVNSPAGDQIIDVVDASLFTGGSLLTADVAFGDLVVNVVDASGFRVGQAIIEDGAPAAEMVVIVNVDTVNNQLTLIGPGITAVLGYAVADAAVIAMQNNGYIFDVIGTEESVTVLGVDTTLNQLRISMPGIIAAGGYNVAVGAAISVSPQILGPVVGPPAALGTSFLLMTPIKTQDTSAGLLILSLEEPEWLVTDKDVEFTGAIPQNAKEDENLTGLAANKIVITDVMIEGEEDLAFYLLFWSTDAFENADLDVDTFLGFVDLDIPSNGFRIGAANQYYLNVTDVNLNYEDEDATNELHVSLLCRTAAGKTAGVPGEVKVKIGYKVRE